MNRTAHPVYTMSEAYRLGWNCGFYGSDAAGRWVDHGRLDSILRHGPRTEDDRAFLAGYRDGRDAHPVRRPAC